MPRFPTEAEIMARDPCGLQNGNFVEVLDQSFFDTLWTPLGSLNAEVPPYANLFTVPREPLDTNVLAPGVLSEHTTYVRGIRAQIHIEGEHEDLWRRIYPLIETGLTFRLMIGQREFFRAALPARAVPGFGTSNVLWLEQPVSPLRPLVVMPKQNVHVELLFDAELREVLNEIYTVPSPAEAALLAKRGDVTALSFTRERRRRKFLRVYLDVSTTRDVA